MSDANTLTVAVISPERTVYEGTATEVIAPAYDGEVGILPGHAAMLTLLGAGVLRMSDGTRLNVHGGFLQVADNVVRVVTERAETA